MRTYRPGDEPIPGYRLIEQLGQGSFGVVWQAEGPGGVLVAMKIISNLNGIHAIREWQSLQNVMNLKQANLVEIYGVWLKNEEGQVLRADEVRALIPQEAEPAVPVSETSSTQPAPRKAVWTGDKPSDGAAARPHRLEGATLQPDDDLPGDSAAGSTAAGSSPALGIGTHRSDATKGTDSGSDQRQAASAGASAAAGSRGKGGKGVPPLELVSAMTLGEGTLMSRLKQCQAQGHGIPRNELLRYMTEAAKGLVYLNDRQMHHCDVKPENLLLVGGSVKVCDYGSALRTIYSAESRTHQGYTEQYAAPEQLSGRKVKLHASTDTYALALTYYALRTGKYPWGDLVTEPIAVIKYSEKFDFSALAKQSPHPFEWQVIRKALKRNPEERYASPLEFVETLEGAVRREEETIRARRRRRIRNTILGTLALLLIAAGVGGWLNRDKIKWPNTPVRTSKDQFYSAVIQNDVAAAVEIANSAEPPLNATDVASGISTALEKISADREQLKDGLQEVLTLKPEYRLALRDPVKSAALKHFATYFTEQIDRREYAQILQVLTRDSALADWNLEEETRVALINGWLDDGRAELAEATHDPAEAAKSVAPLAALASVLADDADRLNELDQAVRQQLGTWLDAAEPALAKVPDLGEARDEFRFVGAAADAYLAARSSAPAEIRSLRSIARLGELAARFRLASEPAAELAKALPAVSQAELASAPAAQARRILLARALGPPDDPELVSERFLTEELPQLRTLPPGWEQETLDAIKKRAIEVAKKEQQAGRLANIDAVLSALQDDRLTLDFARDALAAAASAADMSAFREALALARQRLNPLPKQLDKPADEQARHVLELWLTLLAADALQPGQVAAAVNAVEAWDEDAKGDTRAVAWFPGLVEALARRPSRWPAEFLTSEIAELESPQASTSRIDRHLAALALRGQRLLTLAVEPEPTDEQIALVAQDSGRLAAAREDEESGELIGRFVEPPALVDALWIETQLAPLALANKPASTIPAELKRSLDRLTAHLANQPVRAAPEEPVPFLRYVADLHRAIARPAGDDLANILPPPEDDNPWLAPRQRHDVAATVLLQLAENAGRTPAFTRGADLARQSDLFARQLPLLTRAHAWAMPKSQPQIAAAARLALARCYASPDRDWAAIVSACETALADPQACQTATTREQYTHLLLVYVDGLRHAQANDLGKVIPVIAEILRRECDWYDAASGCIADADLFAWLIEPIRPNLFERDQPKTANPGLVRADLATIYGAVGTLLERDARRRIANDHYEFASGPHRYATALVGSFAKAAELDDDPARKLRWLSGQAMALDRQAELLPSDDYSDLVASLEAIAGQMDELDKTYFAPPALRALAAFYSAPKVNDVADLEGGAAQREAALAGFGTALVALRKHPRADSPWCRTWHSSIQRLASHICLQQSWNQNWGPQMQAKLQEAIRFAIEAKKVAPNPLEEALAASTLGNAYEDMAFYLKCVPFYGRAEGEFQHALEAVKDIDPFQEFLFYRNLFRVRYRRLLHDPAVSDEERKTWKQGLPSDMEKLLAQTKTRGLDRYQSFTEFWLADMLSSLLGEDVAALSRAEELYAKVPQDGSAQARARRYYLAADCAMRLAVLHQDANDAAKSDEAVNRARRYMEPLLGLEQQLRDAGIRSDISQIRADIAADRQDTVDGQFAQYLAESRRSAGVAGLSGAESARLQIRLYLMVAAAPCESDQNFGVRQATVLEVFRLAEANKGLLDRREYVSLLLRATTVALDRAVAYHKKPRATPLPAWELLDMARQALLAARDAEKEMGQVDCCAGPMEPSLGKVSGFDSVWETRSLRLSIARNLIQPIFDSQQKPKQDRIAELTWIKTQLEDLRKALPREGAQADALRSRIDNDHLRLLNRLLDNLKAG